MTTPEQNAREILKQVELSFTTEGGSEYYEGVWFYENSPTPWKTVCLDGEFTPRQLRLIASAMDRAKETLRT